MFSIALPRSLFLFAATYAGLSPPVRSHPWFPRLFSPPAKPPACCGGQASLQQDPLGGSSLPTHLCLCVAHGEQPEHTTPHTPRMASKRSVNSLNSLSANAHGAATRIQFAQSRNDVHGRQLPHHGSPILKRAKMAPASTVRSAAHAKTVLIVNS